MILQKLLPDSAVTAVANLIIDGLAVCCFNRRTNLYWEVAYVRDEGHKFEIEVTERSVADGKPVPGGGHTPYPVPLDLRDLNLIVENGSTTHYQKYPDGYYRSSAPFSRHPCHDCADFRWVIDFVGTEAEHEQVQGLKSKSKFPGRPKVTLLRVPNSLFYTATLTESPAIMSPVSETDPGKGRIFGYTNELIGAAVIAERPGRVILLGHDQGGNEVPVADLEYKAGQFYEIELRNMDTLKSQALYENAGPRAATATAVRKPKIGSYVKGDFHCFYELIDIRAEKKALWGPKSLVQGRLGDCHSVMVSSSIPTLDPLLD